MSTMTNTKRRERLGTTTDGEYIVVDFELRAESGEHQTIDHGTIVDPLTVSLSGDVCVNRFGRVDYLGGGQIIGELARITKPAPGWTLEEVRELAKLWDRWHLNTMRAGCAHMDPATLVREDDGYGGTRISTKENACPETGYRYGHAWLTEPVPADVVGRLEHLMRDRSQDLYRARGYDASGRKVEGVDADTDE